MDTTTSVVLSAVVVAAGRWSQGQSVTIKIVVGGAVLAVMLAGLESANADLASKFALLVLVTSLLVYLVPIVRKLGYAK